jgi:hypothetical protein
MTVFSKENYEEDGRIMQAARKQQYIMFPAPISFLDDELKAELYILQEAEKKQNRILDADYRKVEVDPFVEELKHLTMDEKQILGNTLKKLPFYLVVDQEC